MTNLIIAAVVLIVIMLVFIFILFKNIIKRMDENAKKYFVNKMQDYDYILEEKQAKLEEIKTEIDEMQAANRNILKNDDEYELEEYAQKGRKEKKNEDTIENDEPIRKVAKEEIKYNLNVPNYRETQFFNNYKEVRKVFTVNNEKIIKEFIADHKNLKEEKEYKSLAKIRKKFDEETIYGCLTLSSQDQVKVLKETLTATEKKTVNFDVLSQNKNFSVEDIVKYMDKRMEQIDPTVIIYTNVLDKKYEDLDSNIVTKQYNNMSEGIIIKYRNKIYDYSI